MLNSPFKITIISARPVGRKEVLVLEGKITTCALSDHDAAGALFAMEFACNNHINEILKNQNLRVHITTDTALPS